MLALVVVGHCREIGLGALGWRALVGFRSVDGIVILTIVVFAFIVVGLGLRYRGRLVTKLKLASFFLGSPITRCFLLIVGHGATQSLRDAVSILLMRWISRGIHGQA